LLCRSGRHRARAAPAEPFLARSRQGIQRLVMDLKVQAWRKNRAGCGLAVQRHLRRRTEQIRCPGLIGRCRMICAAERQSMRPHSWHLLLRFNKTAYLPYAVHGSGSIQRAPLIYRLNLGWQFCTQHLRQSMEVGCAGIRSAPNQGDGSAGIGERRSQLMHHRLERAASLKAQSG
jgi:hypothetical protein